MSGRVGSSSDEAGGGAEPALGCWLAGLITWVRSPSAVGIGAVGGSVIGCPGAGAVIVWVACGDCASAAPGTGGQVAGSVVGADAAGVDGGWVEAAGVGPPGGG
jgi:hypothetical protein